jgi:hypothetical protein
MNECSQNIAWSGFLAQDVLTNSKSPPILYSANHDLWISAPNPSHFLSIPLHLLPAAAATHRGRTDPHDGARAAAPGTRLYGRVSSCAALRAPSHRGEPQPPRRELVGPPQELAGSLARWCAASPRDSATSARCRGRQPPLPPHTHRRRSEGRRKRKCVTF